MQLNELGGAPQTMFDRFPNLDAASSRARLEAKQPHLSSLVFSLSCPRLGPEVDSDEDAEKICISG